MRYNVQAPRYLLKVDKEDWTHQTAVIYVYIRVDKATLAGIR